jgi:uncharacterized protein (TIGR03435 family)
MKSTSITKSLIIIAILAAFPACLAQTADKRNDQQLAFEVESVKPHEIRSGRGGSNMTRITSDPSMLRMQAVSAGEMVMFAWNVPAAQIRNAPAWFFQKSFDLSARTSAPSTRSEQRTMLQDLLRRRFGLVCHSETISGSVYELTRTPKFSATKNEESSAEVARFIPRLVVNQDHSTETVYSARHASMADLATWLETQMDRPVVDATETPGTFDLEIHVPGPDVNPEGPNRMTYRDDSQEIMRALASKPGLKLVARSSGKIQVLQIDQIHEPTEN